MSAQRKVRVMPQIDPLVDVVGVASEPLEDGFIFIGPRRKTAWGIEGELSASLAHVASHKVAAHPWEPWPNPAEGAAKLPARRRRGKKTKAAPERQARERQLHG